MRPGYPQGDTPTIYEPLVYRRGIPLRVPWPHCSLVLLGFGLYFMPIEVFRNLCLLAANKGFGHLQCDIVMMLHRWGLHQVGTWTFKGAAQTTVEAELDQAYRVNHHTG